MEKSKASARSPKARSLRGTSKRAATRKKAYDLRLYIAGQTTRAAKALENLEKICMEHLSGQYRIVVIDLLKAPKLARGQQIVAVPTLVRKLPKPVRRIIGDLSDTERVLVGLDIRAR